MLSSSQVQKQVKSLLKREDFSFIRTLARKYRTAEIFLVGGAVRDIFMKAPAVKDYDFVVRNVSPDKVQHTLNQLGWVDLLGKTFGVFKFVPKKRAGSDTKLEPFDIALPRTEHAWGLGGYKDFDVQSDPTLAIEKDLERRDFTINALAIKVFPKFEIIDPFGGLADIRKGIIRTVGKPADRFKEDYSRLLRGMRLACQLGFAIEKQTWAEIMRLTKHLTDLKPNKDRVVPVETISKEFLKAFYHDPVRAFDLYDAAVAFKTLMPELLKMKKCPQPTNYHSEGDVWAHTRLALEQLSSPGYKKLFGKGKPKPQTVMAVLFHDIGKPFTIKTPEKDGTDRIRFNEHDIIGADITRGICERLKLASPDGVGINYDDLHWLIKHHLLLVHSNADKLTNTTLEKYFFNENNPGQNLLRLMYCDGSATIPKGSKKPMLQDFYRLLKRLKSLEKTIRRKKTIVPPILDGHQIMALFKLEPGPQIGRLREALREAQLALKVKTREQGIKFLKQYLRTNKK